MYRVAVIQNESETLRSSYADVTRSLKQLTRLESYEFAPFDGQNVSELFAPGKNNLRTFDSLFISTNATSEADTAQALEDNEHLITEFLRSGRGLFLSYQKKLSSEADAPKPIAFLGPDYRLAAVERPEEDSGDGSVAFTADGRRLESPGAQAVAHHPFEITAEETLQRCLENDFKRHIYRTHFVFDRDRRFETVLADTSYEDPPNRKLLVVNRVARHGERVVASTVALDWEMHADLLTNILVYITQGVPRVAFIRPDGKDREDFDYIVASARLAKIPHRVYPSPEAIPPDLKQLHSIYAFSADWSNANLGEFWHGLVAGEPSAQGLGRKQYKRLYRVGESTEGLVLSEWSNYSSIDHMIDSAVFWIENKYRGGLWSREFWSTHDILLMMLDMGIDVTDYLPGVFADISKHYYAGSYDGVVDATCGLLTLLDRMRANYGASLDSMGFDAARIDEVVAWLAENWQQQSLSGRQVALPALLSNDAHAPMIESVSGLSVKAMKSEQRSSALSTADRLHGLSELELCRLLEPYLVCGVGAEPITQVLKRLLGEQAPSGAWGSDRKTAAVLLTLLRNLGALRSKVAGQIDLDSAVNLGVLYLRSTYDPISSGWNGHLQTTANAAHAIGLYNAAFKHETQRFFDTIAADLTQADIARDLDADREQLSGWIDLNNRLKAHSAEVEAALDDAQAERAQSAVAAHRQFQQLRWARVWLIVLGLTLGGLVASLVISYPDTYRALASSAKSSWPLLIGVILGAVASVVLVWWTSRDE